jgi:hypothetical protein
MKIRCLKASQLMRQANVVCGGSGGVQRRTGDLKEVNNKQIPNDISSESFFPTRLREDGDDDEQ